MQNLKGPANNVFIVNLAFHVLSSIIFSKIDLGYERAKQKVVEKEN